MSSIPLKTITTSSALTSYLLVSYTPQILPFSRQSYIGTFAQLWLLQLCAVLIWKVFLYPKLFSPLRHLPEPSGNSWWNGQFSRIAKEATGVPMMDWVQTVPNDGIIRYLGMLNQERLLITSPKALSEVLTTKNYDFIKPSQVTAGLGRLLGIGVLLAEGDEHKAQRKNLMPAFAFRHIKDLYPVFWRKSQEAVQVMSTEFKTQMAESAKDEVVMEAGAWASRATLDIIGIAGMGQDFGAIKNPDTEISSTYRKVFKPSREAQFLGFLALFIPLWLVRRIPMKRNGEIEEAADIIRSTCTKLIHAKKEKLEKKEPTDVDILSVALESGGFTDENLADQMMTFLAAGHETTASAMTWAIYLLSVHPEMQTRLRQEIRANLPSLDQHDAEVTSLQIDHMPYLNAVCNEVLRYFAPVPMTLRSAARDTTIQGHFVPKGTRVLLCPWATNKDEKLWGPTASKFDPERWLPSDSNPQSANGGAPSNYAFLTFLHGPRSCIGQSFAKAEFACLLAAWIGRLEFCLNDERELEEKNVEIKGGVTARPAKGMHVRVKVLEGW